MRDLVWRRWRGAVQFASLLAALLCALGAAAQAQPPSYTNFETEQVRPLAMSPDGQRLFAVNTPDARLEIFDLTTSLPTHVASVEVGLEPTAVAARSNGEVWVVNFLSDSVSVVDVAANPPRVVRTLLVGDEPRDIVFAGPGHQRAFITTAHRGQNSPYPDGNFATEGIGRADVWVFDANALGSALGGTPLTVLTLFGDKPRALVATPDGSEVYAAIFHSGNRTTTVNEASLCSINSNNCGGVPKLPPPRTNAMGQQQPDTGLIVKYDDASGQWRDERGVDFSYAVKFTLPDYDVFQIDADATVPAETARISGVGTILFNMLINPVTNKLYVTNTEARNRVRFEGRGEFVEQTQPKPPGEPATGRGHFTESRITIIDAAGNVSPRLLNKHIDYAANTIPVPAGVKEKSLSTPVGMALSSDGSTLYVAAFSSQAVGVFDTAALENDTFTPSAADHIQLIGGGPSGLLLDEARGRLYVLTRFDNALNTVRLDTRETVAHDGLYDREPFMVRAGRKFLYDARLTGSNGEASCSSCHIFGDMDDLAWDLGDPDAANGTNPNPLPSGIGPFGGAVNPTGTPFGALKGPMTTQSLRGLADAGPMHWRGDRTGGSTPGGDPLDEEQDFATFGIAFDHQNGRDEGPLDPYSMLLFSSFARSISYPPNPIRQLDDSLRPNEANGRSVFLNNRVDVVATCQGCHTLDRSQGFFGTDGGSTFENEPQHFKVAHLRNMYQKVGMFGMSDITNGHHIDDSFTGEQIRGFGFIHDGSVDTLFNFLNFDVFQGSGVIQGAGGFPSVQAQRDTVSYMMAFDTTFAPIVGQQVTLTASSSQAAYDRVSLMVQRAATPYVMPHDGTFTDCDVIVKGVAAGEARGWVRTQSGVFQSDRASESPVTLEQLGTISQQPGQMLTFTAVPPGQGVRLGIDRDEDGVYDRDELDAATPSDAGQAGCSFAPGQILASKSPIVPALSVFGLLGLAVLSGPRRRRRSGRERRRDQA